jgi:hypothetical protein
MEHRSSCFLLSTSLEYWNPVNIFFFQFPESEDQWLGIARDFENYWNFPHCTGSIDGKHVRVVARGNSGSLLYNYKGYHSIVLMAAVNAKYEFIMVDVGCNGRISDGGVIANTKFYQLLTKGKLRLPPPAKVRNANTEFIHTFLSVTKRLH